MDMLVTLPKNIRQIGSPGDKQKVYIEDYAYTYLHVFLKEKEQESKMQENGADPRVKAALLFGESYEQAGVTYSFIKGAMSYEFSKLQEEFSKEQRAQMEYHFPGWAVLGWFISSPGLENVVQTQVKSYYAQVNVRGPHYLIYEDELERELQIFAWSQNALNYLDGYYIYYEKNPRMQEFLIMQKGGRTQENPVVRTRMELKPEQQQRIQENISYIRGEPQHKSHNFIYAACVAILVLLVAMGISQLGNYQSLNHLQEAISERFMIQQE